MTRALLSASFVVFAACNGGDEPHTDHLHDDTLTVYEFEGRDGGSSVAYSGQSMRQLLIDDMARYIGGLTARIDAGYAPAAGDITTDLSFYLAFDGETSGGLAHDMVTDPPALQSTYGDLSDKDLWGKLAGNDPVGQTQDWSTDLVGWGEPGSLSPQGLVEEWVAEIDAAAADRVNGRIPVDPTGAPINDVAVSPDGLDRKQLIEKFLRGAIAYNQAADDYLDDDTELKGLNADHTQVAAGKGYTELEHAWDEGFGYFGASRYAGELSIETIAESAWTDSDGDGNIDLLTEVTWGHARNAAKRDVGAVQATEFSAEAWSAFTEGRAILAAADGPLSDEDMADLKLARDRALAAWEHTLAANCVHYINDTLADQAAIGTDAYVFADHAKHWSELKGFALSLQFNPRSAMSPTQFAELHQRIGDQPVLGTASTAELEAYADDLRQARSLIGQVYAFNEANLGDDDGQNGW